MKLKNLLLAVLAGGALLACQQEKPVFGISVDKETIEIPQAGGTVSVNVTTAQAWTVNIPSDGKSWLTADPANGSGNSTITFTAGANTGKDRRTHVKVNAGMAGYSGIVISQPGSQLPGDGLTPETAWSASEARAWIMANLSDKQVTTEKYYVKGFIHKVQTTFAASGTYGNAVFFISDDGQASSEDFEAYQVYYLGGKQWKSGQPDVEVGDEVIIYGPITLYGSTPETSGKGAAYIYSHKRNGEDPTPGGGGGDDDYSKAEAKTVAEFIAAADKNTYFKLTGTVSKFNATYCSFDLTDATGTIYVYSVLDAYKSEWASKISNGGTITIAGKYEYYEKKSQHEVVNAAILSFEGGSGGGGDDYSKAEAKTVAEFIAAADENTYYKLSGTVGGSINATYGNYDLTDETGTIYVYGTKNWSEWKSKVKDGSNVVLAAKYKLYQKEGQPDKDEAVEAYIISCEGGEDPGTGGDGDYDSNVTWETGSNNAYDHEATVNGVSGVAVLKLGTGSAAGSSTLTLPAGSTKLTFYALSWKGKPSKLVFKNGGTEVGSVEPAANDGLANTSPYTLTVSDSDKYTISFSATSTLTVETSGSNTRAALFAVIAE